ncbi:ubiquitin carboxyl-terminal hydrolase [Striga asiatica]|uniref:Ubiquitin carboxyl-terminal hydrolase n=1 Tax=Striga asiatica TaxID=4170 RepID=A0A5A7Q804_STRAF|nr:ubiquitin carboxyl-terminal hydrolase [Striga asiatica]
MFLLAQEEEPFAPMSKKDQSYSETPTGFLTAVPYEIQLTFNQASGAHPGTAPPPDCGVDVVDDDDDGSPSSHPPESSFRSTSARGSPPPAAAAWRRRPSRVTAPDS